MAAVNEPVGGALSAIGREPALPDDAQILKPPVITIPTIFRGGPYGPLDLGALSTLPGTWMGTGFNLISRPNQETTFFLELNATNETLTFTPISAPIPNRGSVQPDIAFNGVTYLQQVSDAVTRGGLHVEPGIWISLPETQDPAVPPSVIRLATIPHGNALLAQGQAFSLAGGPDIQPVSSTPIDHATGDPITDPVYLKQFQTTPLPSGIPAGAIANPNLVLIEAIAGLTITSTVVLQVSTTTEFAGDAGAIENVPFLVSNANATRMDATFWIESARLGDDGPQIALPAVHTAGHLELRWDRLAPHLGGNSRQAIDRTKS